MSQYRKGYPMAAQRANWHEDVFFGIHYDLHANAGDTVLGKELTVEHLRERLRRVRPEWIQCDCKGHPGWTSWPTEVGSTSPGVVKDALRAHRDVAAELGIKLGVHYSGVWDSRAIELHPEWARIDEEGRSDPNMTCRLSDYDERLMIPQMLELIDKYDIDGFWVDGENWASRPCWCERCKAEFTRRTGIRRVPVAAGEPHWDQWLAFHRDLFVEHVTRYAEAVHLRKPTCLVCSNWMYTVRQPEPVRAPVNYLSGDFDHAWGSNRAAVEGRLLDGRGMSWDLMAWGFTKTGGMGQNPPWCAKTVRHLCQEVAEVVALGGAVMVYETPQRTGWLTGWRNENLAQVADFCRARKEVCFKSKTAPQAAALHLSSHYYAGNEPLFNYGQAVQPVEGALHALLETHRSTDILTEDSALERMHEYRLLVLPEQTRLSKSIVEALESVARAGRMVLLSGPHLAKDYPELVGATPAGDAITEPTYLLVGNVAVPVSAPWQAAAPKDGTQVLARRLAGQEPTKDLTDQAVVTKRNVGKGAIVAVHGPIFRDYYLGHYPLLRRLVGDLVDALGIDWTVTLDAPPRLEMILRKKDGKLLVNLINRGAGEMLSAQRVVVEELPAVENVVLRVRRDSRPKTVSLLPDGAPVEWSYQAGGLTVKVPRVDIHSVIVIE